jgi:hypothetical protein
MNIDHLPKINTWTSKTAAVLLSLLGLTLFASSSFAQNVTVSGSTGADGSYATLGAAFTALNANTTQTGNTILVTVINDTSEGAAAALNQPTGAWNSLTINPSGARTVSGTVSGHLIDLNGAKNVTIDGLNSGGNSLIIQNTSATASTSTIRFRADTSSDTVTNCTINGAGTSTTSGTIFFDVGASTGNVSNTISNNIITNSGASFPTNAIYSNGLSAVVFNSGTISGNNIQDYFSATSATAGINLSATGNSAGPSRTTSSSRVRVAFTQSQHHREFLLAAAAATPLPETPSVCQRRWNRNDQHDR